MDRRPDWEEVFTRIAERTPSNGKVGVFFCGPHGMASAVQKTLNKVQVMTLLRGVYLGGSNESDLRRELGLSGSRQLHALRKRGSNVRFVLRKENFG